MQGIAAQGITRAYSAGRGVAVALEELDKAIAAAGHVFVRSEFLGSISCSICHYGLSGLVYAVSKPLLELAEGHHLKLCLLHVGVV